MFFVQGCCIQIIYFGEVGFDCIFDGVYGFCYMMVGIIDWFGNDLVDDFEIQQVWISDFYGYSCVFGLGVVFLQDGGIVFW